nr:unnamed protein product [Digitaria exilis]
MGPLLPAAGRAAVTEFVATAIFVFAADGSVYGLWKLYKDTRTPGGLVALAITHALALTASVAGTPTRPSRLACSSAAALLLMLVSGGTRHMGLVELCQGIHERHALLLQAVMTCVLTYAVYATAVDHRSHDTIAPLAIGFVLGANILTGSPFDHAAMNPTRVFGLARVCRATDRAGLAGVLYEFIMVKQQPEAPATAGPRMFTAVAEDY